jgi:hypothetical protein
MGVPGESRSSGCFSLSGSSILANDTFGMLAREDGWVVVETFDWPPVFRKSAGSSILTCCMGSIR